MNTAASNSNYFEQYVSLWPSDYGFIVPQDADAHSQCNWNKPNVDAEFANLLSISNTHDRARLLDVSARHSSDWLHAMPISSCGLQLKNEDICVAVGFRLGTAHINGTAICKPHQCPCGALVDVTGLHSLSCKLSASKHVRHNVINDLITRAVTLADIPCVKNPQGLSRSDEKRPDGMTLIPWKAGKCALWDGTVIDTVAQSYVSQSSQYAGSATELAARRKSFKYGELSSSHFFVPIVLESLGPICLQALSFFCKLGQRISTVSGDVRETAHLFQRLSITMQHFN